MERPPTNQDLLERMQEMESKIEKICTHLDQAMGAWFFVKILGSVAIGATILYNAIHGWIK
jgi:hypothetical protein